MSSELKSETQKIFESISQQIQYTQIFPKDLSYIVADYAICFYIVTYCPSKEDSFKNLIYLSGAEYSPDIKYIKIGEFIYNVARNLSLYPRQIGLNLIQRQNCKVNVNDTIPINLSYYSVPEISEITFFLTNAQWLSYDIKTEYQKITNDMNRFVKYLKDNYKDQILRVRQQIIVTFNNLPFILEVIRITQNKKSSYSIGEDFYGLLSVHSRTILRSKE